MNQYDENFYYVKYQIYKNKYLKLKSKQYGGSFIDGAGIIFVEKYKDDWTILLFREHRNVYSEPGGAMDKNENILDTAIRETREETRNLIHLTRKDLNKNLSIKLKKYVAFLVEIQADAELKSDYDRNVKILDNNPNTHAHWKETHKINRVSIKDLYNLFKSNKLNKQVRIKTALDSSKYIFLRNRTIEVIQKMFENGLLNKYININGIDIPQTILHRKYNCNMLNTICFQS